MQKETENSCLSENITLSEIRIYENIFKILDHIINNKLDGSEGIFRLSANSSRVIEIGKKLKNNEDIKPEIYTVYELANGIKYIIRDLEDGLIKGKGLKILLSLKISAVPEKIMHFVGKSLGTKKDIFDKLMNKLAIIAKNKDNKMGARGIAIIFGPVLIGKSNIKKLSYVQLEEINVKVESLLYNLIVNDLQT